MAENGFLRMNETEFSDDDFSFAHHHGHSHGDSLLHHHHHHHHHHDFDDDEHDRESVITPSITDSDIERLRDVGDFDEEEEIRRNVNHVHHIVNRVRRRGNSNKSSATTTKETTSDAVHVQKFRPTIKKKYLWILLALLSLIAIYLLLPAILRLSFWPFSSSSASSFHFKQFDPSTSEQLASHQLFMQSLEALNDRFETVTKEIHERIQSERTDLRNSNDQELQLVWEELKRLNSLIEAKLKEPCCAGSSLDESTMRRFIEERIAKYDADKTGLPDYALESSGGTIVNTRCSETYLPTASEYRIMGFPIWRTSNSPRTVIQPSSAPGECWAFHGSEGFLVVKLARKIVPTSFTYEHAPKSILFEGAIETSPKNFRVLGLENETDTEGTLLGSYEYDINGEPLQTFPIQNPDSNFFEYIEFRILTNNGNPNYTCLYRFRVHGRVML